MRMVESLTAKGEISATTLEQAATGAIVAAKAAGIERPYALSISPDLRTDSDVLTYGYEVEGYPS